MAFNYYDSFYGYSVGVQISGTIGKKFTYYISHGNQLKRRWIIPPNPNTPTQQFYRDLFRKSVQGWKSLDQDQKIFWEKSKPNHLIMSGFNFYISSYIKHYM